MSSGDGLWGGSERIIIVLYLLVFESEANREKSKGLQAEIWKEEKGVTNLNAEPSKTKLTAQAKLSFLYNKQEKGIMSFVIASPLQTSLFQFQLLKKSIVVSSEQSTIVAEVPPNNSSAVEKSNK
jgi:hypothetical protein